MRWRCAVTFETPNTAAPASVRVEVDAKAAGTALRRAFDAAKRKMPGKQWTSLVVLIERAGGQ